VFLSRYGLCYAAEMQRLIRLVSLLTVACLSAGPALASSPEQEKEFTDKYKTAFEANDSATLESFLYTQGADPTAEKDGKLVIPVPVPVK
jgi:hypothetical protein